MGHQVEGHFEVQARGELVLRNAGHHPVGDLIAGLRAIQVLNSLREPFAVVRGSDDARVAVKLERPIGKLARSLSASFLWGLPLVACSDLASGRGGRVGRICAARGPTRVGDILSAPRPRFSVPPALVGLLPLAEEGAQDLLAHVELQVVSHLFHAKVHGVDLRREALLGLHVNAQLAQALVRTEPARSRDLWIYAGKELLEALVVLSLLGLDISPARSTFCGPALLVLGLLSFVSLRKSRSNFLGIETLIYAPRQHVPHAYRSASVLGQYPLAIVEDFVLHDRGDADEGQARRPLKRNHWLALAHALAEARLLDRKRRGAGYKGTVPPLPVRVAATAFSLFTVPRRWLRKVPEMNGGAVRGAPDPLEGLAPAAHVAAPAARVAAPASGREGEHRLLLLEEQRAELS
mmetsp:Transcript_9382/g.26687  ORF Transcript_9382/g.26687 Transcript_9382/m.26687 type:complete len:407 (+) Transcript_9382:2843-4063(+)